MTQKARSRTPGNFHQTIAMPNLMVKIPATEAGVPAIRQMISEGRNINVTLIFSLERYNDVVEAYISGLEALGSSGGDVSRAHSVASFFVSRVDTEVDRRLERLLGDPDQASQLRGKAAVAQAKLAYGLFPGPFLGPTMGGLGGQRRSRATAAVGFYFHQEPGVPRPALRRQPHRAADR